jgi:hypothetical protein
VFPETNRASNGMKKKNPEVARRRPARCDLTPKGSDAISHLAFHFVNEKLTQNPKKRGIAFAPEVEGA